MFVDDDRDVHDEPVLPGDGGGLGAQLAGRHFRTPDVRPRGLRIRPRLPPGAVDREEEAGGLRSADDGRRTRVDEDEAPDLQRVVSDDQSVQRREAGVVDGQREGLLGREAAGIGRRGRDRRRARSSPREDHRGVSVGVDDDLRSGDGGIRHRDGKLQICEVVVGVFEPRGRHPGHGSPSRRQAHRVTGEVAPGQRSQVGRDGER